MPTDTQATISLAAGFSREYLLHHRVCPLGWTDDASLLVATTSSVVRDALSELAIAYRSATVRTEEVADDVIDRMIERLCAAADRAIELARPAVEDDDGTTADVREIANQPPVVRYVNLLVRDAFDAAASDIHLEATREGLAVRFRLDGLLSPAAPPTGLPMQAVTSRIKLLAELDISERRRPQDGRLRVRLESRDLDVRVSTVPTMHGESVVLRLLDSGGRPVSLDSLGMPPQMLAQVLQVISRPHGLVLVTGPTGSGKTTTLHAALLHRNRGSEKVLTVEDPVEYELPGITQLPVHREAGVTFGTALRALLRQDPDVIMIGEMRDAETAEIAVQAAMTGHLVLSTLHTNDAVGAIGRLRDLAVPAFLIAATLESVVAQRLVRRICDACKTSYVPNPAELERVGANTVLHRGLGCSSCRGTGFRGRVGLFEQVLVDDELKAAILTAAPDSELRRIAIAGGMIPMMMDGWDKVRLGQTTIEEVLRSYDSEFTTPGET